MADADKTIELEPAFTTGHILRARVCEMTEDWSRPATRIFPVRISQNKSYYIVS